jgi:NAD(P)-dependent dehydrogenase (short-subunit alcohol dehydrogenase family)
MLPYNIQVSIRWIVVTGASTGIGRAATMLLASSGLAVIAGVRKIEDAESLRKESAGVGRVEPVMLDVTNAAHITDLVTRLPDLASDSALYGLVNNAGIARVGPTECLSTMTWQQQYATNLFGPIALTAEMIPFLRRARGRIVNVSSIGGKCALPFMAPYTSSKFAMEGWSDSLRLELEPDGIHVAIVEPGAIATPMWAKGKDEGQRLSEQLPAHLQQRYGGPMESLQAASTRSAKAAIPPEKVARAILQALTVRRPRTRYIVGTDAHVQALMHWLLPDRAMDSVLRAALGLRKQRAR